MPDSVTPWTIAGQPPVSLGFPRQEYYSGVPFPSPGDLPDPGIEPVSPALAGKLLTIEPPEKPKKVFSETQNSYKNSDLSLKEKKKKSLSGFLVHPKWFSVFVVVQSLSHIWLFATPWTAGRQASLSLTISWSLLKFSSTKSAMPSRPLLLLLSIFLSTWVFPKASALCIKWPNYQSFSFSLSPSNEYSGWISLFFITCI